MIGVSGKSHCLTRLLRLMLSLMETKSTNTMGKATPEQLLASIVEGLNTALLGI
jgi:hypothetical protein